MTEISQIMPRLLADFPDFRARWDKYLSSYDGETPGPYIDIAEFVHFVVEELYPKGETEKLQRAFDMMEKWISEDDQNLRDLIGFGFLETLRNFASWRPFGSEVFIQFLGKNSEQAWAEIEQMWAGKSSLMDVIRAERTDPKNSK